MSRNDDLAQRAARHRPQETKTHAADHALCAGCFCSWPCDASLFAAARAAAQAETHAAEERVRLLQMAYDDFTTGTYEMLGELLTEHQIVPDPCPRPPCVAAATLAIGRTITTLRQQVAAEQAARARAEARESKLRGALHGLTSYAVMAEQYVPEPVRTAQHWLIEQAQKAF